MINIEQMALVLDALPDPTFVLSKSGKYIAVFGGKDERYYHDGSGLIGLYLADVLKTDKLNYFLTTIEMALSSHKLLIEEYELSSKDVKGLPDIGPEHPIWFEGRIQALDFLVDNEPVVLWVASNISQRHKLEIQLRQFSDTDQLTGLFNRRRLEQDLTEQFEISQHNHTSASILVLDLDHLKAINDNLGHHIGDKVIMTVADICRKQLTAIDNAYRFGGDEFVIALPGQQLEQALVFAEHLCQCLYIELQKHIVDGVFATMSIGVASIHPRDKSYEETLKRADAALYQAKRSGKNRVIAKHI